MIQTKSLVALALLSASGLSLLVFSCALANYNWWPSLVVIFYVLAPVPLAIASKIRDSEYTNARDFMFFTSAALVASAFGLPIVLARASLIKTGSTLLAISANCVIYATTAYFIKINQDETYLYY